MYFDNILIHLGYLKTGSTWLQKELFFSGSSQFEPVSYKKAGPSGYIKSFLKDEEGYLLSSFDNNINTLQKEIEEIFFSKKDAFKNKIPVFSAELLSGNPHSGGFYAQKISNQLKILFPEAKILLVIREQRSWILSNYFQYLKQGGTNSIKRYLHNDFDLRYPPDFSPNHVKYNFPVKAYQNLFGKEKVLVLPYEMFKSNPREFLTYVEKFLNIKIQIPSEKTKKKWNDSKFFWARYYLRFLNLFVRESNETEKSGFNKYIRKAIGRIIIIVGSLTPAIFNKLLLKKVERVIHDFSKQRYIESNKEVSKMIGIDLSCWGYY